MAEDVSNQPIEVTAVPGAVVILAPQGPVALTASAALRSAERLIDAATRVMHGQVQPPSQE